MVARHRLGRTVDDRVGQCSSRSRSSQAVLLISRAELLMAEDGWAMLISRAAPPGQGWRVGDVVSSTGAWRRSKTMGGGAARVGTHWGLSVMGKI
jgi:hypothetical protein